MTEFHYYAKDIYGNAGGKIILHNGFLDKIFSICFEIPFFG
jgi:hypothetical protein